MLPKKIRVGSMTYKIIRDNKKFQKFLGKKKDVEDYWGYSSYNKNQIFINDNIKDCRLPVILLHEIMHTTLEQSLNPLESDEEERVIRALASSLIDTIKRNDGLKEILFDE